MCRVAANSGSAFYPSLCSLPLSFSTCWNKCFHLKGMEALKPAGSTDWVSLLCLSVAWVVYQLVLLPTAHQSVLEWVRIQPTAFVALSPTILPNVFPLSCKMCFRRVLNVVANYTVFKMNEQITASRIYWCFRCNCDFPQLIEHIIDNYPGVKSNYILHNIYGMRRNCNPTRAFKYTLHGSCFKV